MALCSTKNNHRRHRRSVVHEPDRAERVHSFAVQEVMAARKPKNGGQFTDSLCAVGIRRETKGGTPDEKSVLSDGALSYALHVHSITIGSPPGRDAGEKQPAPRRHLRTAGATLCRRRS